MDGMVTIGTRLETKSFDAQITQLEKKLEMLEKSADESDIPKQFRRSAEETRELNAEIEKTRNKLGELVRKQNELDKKGISNIKESLGNIGNSMEGVIKKVSRWALAVFGVRSAYLFVRQSMSTLSQYDEQMATDVEYIRWALAMTIKPVIEWIIKAVYTVLGVIGSIAKSLFGVNIFANASADAFKNAKDSLKGSNKEAKQLQKTLAGFDEMNVLQENGSTTTGGGGGISPSFGLEDVFDSSSVQGFMNFWKDIFDFWEDGWKDFINTLDGNWATFFSGIIVYFKGIWDVLKGYGEIIIGLVEMIFGLVTGDFDLVKQGFNILIEGIKNVLTGFFEMVTGTLLVVFGFIKGIVLSIWDFIYGNIIKPIFDFFGNLVGAIVGTVGDIFNKVKDKFGQLVDICKKPFQAVIDTVKGIWDAIKKPIDKLVKNINKALDKINPINILGDVGKGIGKGIGSIGKLFGFSKGGIVKLATGGVINNPGSGVPLATAIGGERGAEGVIPLTDSQQMELLGEAIGRYITVNLTNITKLDGRQIARKVDKVNQSNDFVFNR